MRLPYDTRGASADPVRAQPITLRGTADAGGACTLRTNPVDQGRQWLVNYLTVTSSGANVPTCDLYVDDETLLANLLDGTSDSAGVASYNPPRVIGQGETIVAVWTGADPGASCALRIEYDVQAL